MAEISSLFPQSNVDKYIQSVTAKEKKPVEDLEKKKTALEARNTVLSGLKSKLSTLRTRLKGFTAVGTEAKLGSKTAVSSDDSVFTSSVESNASTGTHTISIERIAKNDIVVTDVIKKTDNDIADSVDLKDHEFSITLGSADPIDIEFSVTDADETNEDLLNRLASTINTKVEDVSAVVVSNGKKKARLSITTDQAGSANAISFADSASFDLLEEIGLVEEGKGKDKDDDVDDDESFVRTEAKSNSGGYITEDSENLDALLTVNGIEISSSDNSISDAIKGVTVNLRKASSGDETLTVTMDTDTVKEEVEGFISEYNSALDFLVTNSKIDRTTNKRGELAGIHSFSKLKLDLRTQVSGKVSGIDSGKPSTLNDIGVSVSRVGKLSLGDVSTFEDKLTEDPDSIVNLFTSEPGIANTVIDTLENFTLTGNKIDIDISLGKTKIRNINKQIKRYDTRFQVRETSLRRQYAQIEKTLSLLNSQQSLLRKYGFSFDNFLSGSSSSSSTSSNIFRF